MVEKLIEVKNLREVWENEALDFTPWLIKDNNIDILSEAVGIDIEIEERESSVGNFNVDILANEVGTGRTIIIENQIEKSNHDHLGKLITYASGKDANIIIWITKKACEEHRAAVEWLNNHTDDEIGFFLCEVKLYRIGNSEPAVKFEVIEKPNDWTKEIKKNESTSPNQQRRLEFWRMFNEYVNKNKQFMKAFNLRKPSTDAWMDFAIGSSACHLAVNQIKKRNEITVELYISDDKELFHSIYSAKDSIEKELGFSLEWLELPDRKASRILVIKTADLEDRSQWEEQFNWIMETLLKMKGVFTKYV